MVVVAVHLDDFVLNGSDGGDALQPTLAAAHPARAHAAAPLPDEIETTDADHRVPAAGQHEPDAWNS